MTILAEVRDDERVVGSGRRIGEIGAQLAEIDVVRDALTGIEQRLKIDERIVPRRVLIAEAGVHRGIRRIEERTATGNDEILNVRLPRQPLFRELIGHGFCRGWIDAALSERLIEE